MDGKDLQDEILDCDDLTRERVEVPEWGGRAIYVAEIGASDRDRLDSEASDLSKRFEADKGRFFSEYRLLVLHCTCQREDGSQLFTRENLPRLGKKNPSAIARLFEVADRVNRLSQKQIKEVEGKSEGGQSAS